jgi:hypothetical protein
MVFITLHRTCCIHACTYGSLHDVLIHGFEMLVSESYVSGDWCGMHAQCCGNADQKNQDGPSLQPSMQCKRRVDKQIHSLQAQDSREGSSYIIMCSQAVTVCSFSPSIYAQGECFLMRRNCNCNRHESVHMYALYRHMFPINCHLFQAMMHHSPACHNQACCREVVVNVHQASTLEIV